ncbi:MAG TPA: DUF2799 domain-containing protein, partial [Mariprofundaceae bacterium]|nr:DUF2799 domain-containing protein [Mariprofundaceae bacterium]
MNLLRIPMILVALGLLAGCATMSKKECETADWRSLGYSDGARGIYYSNLEKRRDSCSKYNIVPDDSAYMNGWGEGIRRYCTPDTGFQVGSAGQPYNNICPPDVEPAFLSGWQQGVRQYCVPENALQLGLNGYPYRGVCPPDLAGQFQNFYRLGVDVRQARANHQYL